MTTREQKRQRRERQARWRESHPVLAAWHDHKCNAKKRGIPVTWDFEEFQAWCFETGYHFLRRDGFQIHRTGDIGAYKASRCSCIPAQVNRALQEVEKKKARYKAWREKVVAENLKANVS